MLKMPKLKELVGESQERNMAKCINEDDIRSFTNFRTYKMWRRIHDKRCSCLLDKADTPVKPATEAEVRSYGMNGNESRKQKEFLEGIKK